MRIKAVQVQLLEKSFIKRNHMDQEMENLIWDYIDGQINPAEKETVSRRLLEDPEWRIKFEELKTIHALLQKEELDTPPLRFTKNVMEEIAKYHVAPATRNYINKNIIRGITCFFLVMIAGLFIYFLGQLHWTGSPSGSLVPTTLDAAKLNWGKMLNNTYVEMFVGVNVILALILIDKYIQGRKNAAHNGH